MKKFGLVIAGGIAAMVLLSTIGTYDRTCWSAWMILYFILKQFLKDQIR